MRVTGLSAAVILAWSVVAVPARAESASDLNDRGVRACQQGNYEAGIRDFTTAINMGTLGPTDLSHAYSNRGQAYNDQGDYERALADINKALGINPRSPTAWFNHGLTCYNKGDYDQTVLDCGKAIELNPRYAEAYNNRGNAYDAKGDYDRALADFSKYAELRPRDPTAFGNRGMAYWHKGQHDQALADYEKALILKADSARLYRGRGAVYRSRGDLDRAIADYDKAVALDPQNAFGRIALFLVQSEAGKPPGKDLAEFRKTMKDGEWATTLVRLCLGEITPETCLAAAANANPKKDKEQKCEAHYYTGQLYLLKGQKDKAQAHFRESVASGVANYAEYTSAAQALKRLEPH